MIRSRDEAMVKRWGRGGEGKGMNFFKVFHPIIRKVELFPRSLPAGNRTREITRTKRILILTKSTPVKILESARGQGRGGGQRY